MAYAYAEGCPPLRYQVKGAISADESTIRMNGMEPQRNAHCDVVGAVGRELVFSLVEKTQAIARGEGEWLPRTE